MLPLVKLNAEYISLNITTIHEIWRKSVQHKYIRTYVLPRQLPATAVLIGNYIFV